MDNNTTMTTLQNRVNELEHQLSAANAVISALTRQTRAQPGHQFAAEPGFSEAEGQCNAEKINILDSEKDWQSALNNALRRSEEKFSQVFQLNPIGLAIARVTDAHITDVNASFCEIVGYTREQIVGPASMDLGFFTKAAAEDVILQFQTQGRVHNQEFNIVTKSQLTRCVMLSLDPIEIEGEPGMLVTMIDITGRKQAEKALAESERRQREITRLLELDQAKLAAVLRHLPVGVWIVDQNGRVVGSNEQAERVRVGQSSISNGTNENPKNTSWSLGDGKLLQPEHDPVEVALRTGKSVEPVEIIVRRPDGSQETMLVSAAPIKDGQGLITGAVSVNVDITLRKQAEGALQQSEWRMNRAQEIAHLGSWELDIVNDQLTWSDEVYRIFGLQPQEFGATYEAFLEAIHPDDRAAVDAVYSSSLREGRDQYEIEHRVVRRCNGEVRIVHEKCEHFRNDVGQVIRSVGMVHDITERKHAEEQLRGYSEWLKKNNLDVLDPS